VFDEWTVRSDSQMIRPMIISGQAELIVSETFTVQAKNGAKLIIPLAMTRDNQVTNIEISFVFTHSDGPGLRMLMETKQSSIFITLQNFDSPLPSGSSKPIEFEVAGVKFELSFSGVAVVNATDAGLTMITLTVSLFRKIA
jgi:hypothetical protein